MNDFTIDRVSWYTSRDSSPAVAEQARGRLQALAKFLDANCLSIQRLLPADKNIDNEFAIKRSDLTEEGFELIKKAHDKWLKSFNKNPSKPPEDVSVLEKELKKLRP